MHLALLVAIALPVGWGLLTVLRFPTEPRRRLLLAPFAATAFWALAGNLPVRLGFTLARVTPWIAVLSLGLALAGIRSARGRLRPGALALIASLALVAGLVTWPHVVRGLTAHIGSHNLDTVNYTSMAAGFWRHGIDTSSIHLPFFERYARALKSLGEGRNHTFVLLAVLSPLVEPGEPIFVRNIFVYWSFFVFACNLAFYRLSWRRATGPTATTPTEILAYVVLTVGIGWAAIPALVGNWDNALLVSVGPVLAALARDPESGRRYGVALGVTFVYALYSFTELAPLLGLFVLPLYLHQTLSRRRVVTYAVAIAVAATLFTPGLKHLSLYFFRQAHSRPGGGFAGGLATLPLHPASWWALGTEHGSRTVGIPMVLYGSLLAGLAAAGVLRLVRRRDWGEVASLGLVAASLAYFVIISRYGYGAYKILSVTWWLVSRFLAEGCAVVIGAARDRRKAREGGRLWHYATVGVLVGFLGLVLFESGRSRFSNFSANWVFEGQPTLAALVRLRERAGRQPPADVLVVDPGDLAVPWIYYALKDTPLRLYESAATMGVPGAATWPSQKPLPRTALVGQRDLFAAPSARGSFDPSFVDLQSMTTVVHVDSPNRIEAWGTWLGTQPIVISLLGRRGLSVALHFDATPGYSLPGTPHRTMVLRRGARELGRVEIEGPAPVLFQFTMADDVEALALSSPDTPTVAAMANGDRRPLVVALRNLRVAPALQDGAP